MTLLDRDGVINDEPPEPGWAMRWEDFAFAEGALEALRRLHEAGFTVAVVSNQSCVSRGYASREQIQAIMDRMAQEVAAAGGAIAGVYWCPHVDADECACRKPKPGLIDQAAADLGLRPERAFLVGDSERDIAAGRARGCTTVLVDNHGDGRAEATQADHVVGSLAEAVDTILTLVDG
ncbi:MAG: D-glycero-alpha-D-manno-heptose-1,7-bisphosphate 7-phosphatase [Planctomycetota bacterium]